MPLTRSDAIARIVPVRGRRSPPLAAQAPPVQRMLLDQIAGLGLTAHAATVLPAEAGAPALTPLQVGAQVRAMGTLGMLAQRMERTFGNDARFIEICDDGAADPFSHLGDLASAVLERHAPPVEAKDPHAARKEFESRMMRVFAEVSESPDDDEDEEPGEGASTKDDVEWPTDLEIKAHLPDLEYGAPVRGTLVVAPPHGRKRGGQPGNPNAVKSGKRSAAAIASTAAVRAGHRARLHTAGEVETKARSLLAAVARPRRRRAKSQISANECTGADPFPPAPQPAAPSEPIRELVESGESVVIL